MTHAYNNYKTPETDAGLPHTQNQLGPKTKQNNAIKEKRDSLLIIKIFSQNNTFYGNKLLIQLITRDVN